jgi:hypothetical protein
MVTLRHDQKGAVAPLCVGLLIVLALAGFGTWGLLRAWRFKVETQFRLDHRVAQEALALKQSIAVVESSNQRMTMIRETALTGSVVLNAAAMAAIRAELEVEKILQEGIRLKWEATQAEWLLTQPGSSMKLADWTRLPDDELGAQPFNWSDADFELETRSGSRKAAAKISGDRTNETPAHEWHAEWTNFR